MKSTCLAITAAVLLGACATDPQTASEEGVEKEETYVPIGSMIARKGSASRNNTKQTVLSGDAARDMIDRVPPTGPGQ